MIDVIIIEDVVAIRDTLKVLLLDRYQSLRIVGQCDNVAEAKQLIHQFKPHVLLLDIDLKDGSGFDLLKQLSYKKFELIFITGDNTKGIEAIKHNATDYVLKPVKSRDLYSAIDKAIERIEKEKQSQSLELIQTSLKSIAPQKRIILKNNTLVHSVALNEIVRCESEGRYTTFYLINGKQHIMATAIKEYEEHLLNDGFFRVHQSHLINVIYFDSLIKQPESIIHLKNGDKVPLAERKKQEFLQFLESF